MSSRENFLSGSGVLFERVLGATSTRPFLDVGFKSAASRLLEVGSA